MITPGREPAVAGTVGRAARGVGLVALVAAVIASATSPGAMAAEPLDLAIRLEPVAEGLESPVLLLGAGDASGERYVVEKAGRVVRLGSDGSIGETLLDIRDRVLDHHERGLLGLAFHPDFAENGRFVVAYSRRDDGATNISEFQLPGEPEPPEAGEEPEEPEPIERTEKPLLVIAQPHSTHKGGMLAFDAEGMLLISIGDGGSSWDPYENGLDVTSLLGKLLRIDVDAGWPYAIPEDNGFAGVGGARGEIHAIGLRNPWRFSVDPATGDVLIADVGQDEWEEVNALPHGEREVSFGWSDFDANRCRIDDGCGDWHRAPAIAYHHVGEDGTGHCAVIGGHVYRGAAGSLPDGTYLYADYCSGTLWAVPVEQLFEGEAAPTVAARLDPELGLPVGFGRDDDGELYLLTDAGGVLHIRSA